MNKLTVFAFEDGDNPPAEGRPDNSAMIIEKINSFPDSYRAALFELHEKHPEWIFEPFFTDLDWQTSVDREIVGGKSLVSGSYFGYHKEGYCEPGWYFAAENTLKWYMDPRSWLDEQHIFMYELLSYNEECHSQEALADFLAPSFMKTTDEEGNPIFAPGTELTYDYIFHEAGIQHNVSPFHLAARVYQEQGMNGSPMVSGTYAGYEGLYNYFNINATSGTSAQKLAQGLSWAREKGWDNAYTAIIGGSDLIASGYIARGQDTLYLQKFNVTNRSTYSHQYMQNIAAPSSEAVTTYKMYEKVDKVDCAFIFKIPVYNNMPEIITPKPTMSTNLVIQIPAGYSGIVYVDGVRMDGVSRNGQYIINAGNTEAKVAVTYAYGDDGKPYKACYWMFEYAPSRFYQITSQFEKSAEDGDIFNSGLEGWVKASSGKMYWYENGVLQGTEGRGKEIYDPASDAWYWLDSIQGGAKAVSKDVYQESLAGVWGDKVLSDGTRVGKWVRYDGNGHMVKGWQYTDGGTYYFDLEYGTMAKGVAQIDGKTYNFDTTTGVLIGEGTDGYKDGWNLINGDYYWYENGIRQGYSENPSYRGKEIYDPASDAWYWLDNIDGGRKAVSKDVYQESLSGIWGDRKVYTADGKIDVEATTGKWVRYDENGHMVKGWQANEKGTYYFDLVYGTMAKGEAVIDGETYYFDEETGLLMGFE